MQRILLFCKTIKFTQELQGKTTNQDVENQNLYWSPNKSSTLHPKTLPNKQCFLFRKVMVVKLITTVTTQITKHGNWYKIEKHLEH